MYQSGTLVRMTSISTVAYRVGPRGESTPVVDMTGDPLTPTRPALI